MKLDHIFRPDFVFWRFMSIVFIPSVRLVSRKYCLGLNNSRGFILSSKNYHATWAAFSKKWIRRQNSKIYQKISLEFLLCLFLPLSLFLPAFTVECSPPAPYKIVINKIHAKNRSMRCYEVKKCSLAALDHHALNVKEKIIIKKYL